MVSERQRPIVYAALAVVVVWLLAWGGFVAARNFRMTADKLKAQVHSLDLGRLSAAARAQALADLAAKLNTLSLDERRKARLDGEWARLFEQMSEEEKGAFIDATMPTGFKQMIKAFEELPEAKRRTAIDDALKRMQAARAAGAPPNANRPGQPPISDELRQKIMKTGLSTYFNESSAQTKAELAPLLEEIQRSMETGRMFRPPHGPHE